MRGLRILVRRFSKLARYVHKAFLVEDCNRHTTDIVTISEKGQPPRMFSSAEYYERAKIFSSARRTRQWNEDTLEDVTNLPSSKTADLDKLKSHCKRYIEVLPRITKHRATKGYRAMRFTRYVYRAKAIRNFESCYPRRFRWPL